MQYNEPNLCLKPNNTRFYEYLTNGPLQDMNSYMSSSVFMNKSLPDEPKVFNYIGYQHGEPEYYTQETSLAFKPLPAWDPIKAGIPILRKPPYQPSYS
jgi:hypothetical protein